MFSTGVLRCFFALPAVFLDGSGSRELNVRHLRRPNDPGSRGPDGTCCDTLDDGVVLLVVMVKTYRLLRAILRTAANDEIIARDPYRIRGTGTESALEGPMLSVAQVFNLARRLPEPYGLMALVGIFGSLR